jgi:hypothetical protein
METPQVQSFKSKWNETDFKKMKAALSRNFLGKPLSTAAGEQKVYTYKALENLLGLPYTSDFGALWVTNTDLLSNKFPGYRYWGFAIGEDGNCYGIVKDKKEAEIIVPI